MFGVLMAKRMGREPGTAGPVRSRNMARRVGVFGAAGRMGSTVCAAVLTDPELELVAVVDPGAEGAEVAGLTIAASPDALAEAAAEVAVDFTVADAARKNLRWCAAHGVHAVVGTTGLSSSDLDELRKHFTRSSCLVAPNFAIGAVLMMRFAELAAPFFETAEVIELHHDAKTDAPSGTAMMTVQRMAAASSTWAADPTRHEVVRGARGGAADGGIHVHSVRLRGLVAHQEVLLGTAGQSLTIRHDSYDRTSFMPGVLLAVKQVDSRPGVTVGLDAVLGL
jgi:4-hydroxy-tetrahydrodipicolinate reductase